jgi:hypothetical protein
MKIKPKELGHRTDAELEALFCNMYAGWDRGVNVTQERFGNGETRFAESPMTPLELAARYVAAEIGANIHEIANRAAFAPIIVFSQIQSRIGPVFADRDELRGILLLCGELGGIGKDETPATYLRRLIDGLIDARRERDEAYERLRPFAAQFDLNDCDCRKDDDAMEVPIGDLRAARDLVSRLASGLDRSTP